MLGWWLSGKNYLELTQSFSIPQQAKTIESKESWVRTIRDLIAAAGNNVLKLFVSFFCPLFFSLYLCSSETYNYILQKVISNS